MAVQPLSPATNRRLGGPLPHQLANWTRVHPEATRTFYPTADFAKFDMIIGMDDQNIEALKRAAINEEERAKIFKMTDFCRKSTLYSEIPDPYYEGPQGFELVLDLLEDAVAGLYRYCLAHY